MLIMKKMNKRPNAFSTSSTTTVQDTTNLPRKRVNSKEEVPSVTGEEANDDMPGRVVTNVDLEVVDHKEAMTTTAFEEKLKNREVQIKAEKALTLAFCSESLKCLFEVFAWEAQSDPKIKKSIRTRVVQQYIQPGSLHEICLPEALRTSILTGEDPANDMMSIKKHVLNDLRFNQKLLLVLEQ